MREHTARDPFAPVVRCAADLLAVVPHTLGYWPDDSLVLFAAGGRTAGACVRVDLPGAPHDGRFAEGFVAELAELVGHDALSDRVFAVVYASAGPAAAPAVLGLVDEAAARAGRHVAARWIVSGDRWWPAEDPGDVQDVAAVLDSAVNAALVATGSSYAAAPRLAMDHEYGGLPAGTVRDVAGHAVAWARAGAGSWHRLERLARVLAVWTDVLRAVPEAPGDWVAAVLGHDDELLGFLAAGLTDPVLTDLLLAACATDDPHGVLAGAAMWAELGEEDPGADPGGGDPSGPVRAPAPAGTPPVPRPPGGGGASGGPGGGWVPVPDPEELIRLSRVLTGEWEQAPAWSSLDALYRVLQALSWLLEADTADRVPDGPEEEARRSVLAGVLVGLAQLNRFRARGSHTAHFVRRATALVPGQPAALRVLRLTGARPVPLWARDRATAWHS